jgi:hypothetical protein
MTKTTAQAAAFALASLMTSATIAGMNGIAARQYAVADALAMASGARTQVAVQHVTIVGHRANA